MTISAYGNTPWNNETINVFALVIFCLPLHFSLLSDLSLAPVSEAHDSHGTTFTLFCLTHSSKKQHSVPAVEGRCQLQGEAGKKEYVARGQMEDEQWEQDEEKDSHIRAMNPLILDFHVYRATTTVPASHHLLCLSSVPCDRLNSVTSVFKASNHLSETLQYKTEAVKTLVVLCGEQHTLT